MADPVRRPSLLLRGALLIGLGLAIAPAVFQMFSRAPAGGQMITEFRPYMRAAVLRDFDADLAIIDAAASEVTAASLGSGTPTLRAFEKEWPRIDREMGAMLSTIESNLGRFEGLVALPPFWAFPWFFVLPGLMIAALAAWALKRQPADRRTPVLVLIALAMAVIAAPAVFQMFTRAPGGAAMIDDFRPLMTQVNIGEVQGNFLVIAGAEGHLRNEVLSRPELAASLPATSRFVEEWPRISGDMAPMIGAMADNLDNFAAVDALPPFWLFPWFFVIPGLLVAGLAFGARPAQPARLAGVPLPTATHAFERSSS